MAINNVGSNSAIQSGAANVSRAADSESMNLRNQLTVKQQRLKKVSSDAGMDEEEKAKERREIQKQIDELNRKIKLKKMEEKQEEAKEAKEQEKKRVMKEELLDKAVSRDKDEKASEKLPDKEKETLEDIGLPVENVQQVLAADTAVEQQSVHEQVARKKTAAEDVLEAEIKSDTLYGTDTEAKREALSEMRRQESYLSDSTQETSPTDPLGILSGVKTIIRE